MKKILLMIAVALSSLMALAQERTITGTVVDKSAHEVLPMVTVQLLKSDSSYVAGALSNDSGRFVLQAPAESNTYIVKLSSIGYKPLLQTVHLNKGQSLQMGRLSMVADAIMLKGAEVTAQAQKVVLKEDTFIYNASAYRTPEGSTIEELVKRLPGAQVADDGKITINGKEVKKILVDGKEFMTGDTKTAMKNIPTSIINKVKSYDQQSDLARVTGIQDGEEQTVLDFGTKPGMNKGLMANADVGVGTHDRYSSRLFGGYFNKDMRIMGMGNANNVNDMGFGGRGGSFMRARNGLSASKMAGLNFNYEKKNKIIVDASARWNHSDGDTNSKRSSQNFVSTVGSFSNSLGQSYSRSNSFNANARIEWTPDTMTNIMFRPTVSLSNSDGLSSNRAASFNDDPYLYVNDPLVAEAMQILASDSVIVNSNVSNSITYSRTNTLGGVLQVNRRLNSRGRNVTLRGNVSYTDGKSNSFSINNVHLYQLKNILGEDSTYQTNRYNLAPSKKWSYSVQTTYSEPLWKGAFLQFSYQYTYSYNKSDRHTYDFSNLGEDFFSGLTATYRSWDGYLARLSKPYTDYLDDDLSRFSEYKNYQHNINVMLRMIRNKWQLNAGVMFQPLHSSYVQDYLGVAVDTTRNVLNFSPTFDLRYRFTKVSNLRINYNATTTQPSISQLLAITDDSDPLNISTGNPGLKPAFTQNMRLFFNNYSEKTRQALMTFINYSNTRNSISNRVTYNETTGGRLTRPENINGNWSMSSAFMFNTPLDSAGYWNVNTWTNFSYSNNVGYVSLDRKSESLKNVTRDMTVSERLAGSYRNSWLEIELNGSFDYRHSKNKLQPASNLNTWQFSYGGNISLTAPWGTTLATDLNMNSRRGYSDKSLNTNELVWNAQLSQGFLRGKPLVVMLQFYDILQKQSNLSRSITASMRSDTEYNAINSYVMLHVNYRFNLFGTKEARRGMRGRDGYGGPGMGPGMGPGGGRPPRDGGGGPGRPRG